MITKKIFIRLYELEKMHSGNTWDVYQNEERFVFKFLKDNITTKKRSYYQNLLYEMNLKKRNFNELNTLNNPIFLEKQFAGYRVKKEPGIDFYQFVEEKDLSLQTLIQLHEKIYQFLSKVRNNMIFPDMNTSGNILYDSQKQQFHFIDIDGIQLPNQPGYSYWPLFDTFAFTDFPDIPSFAFEEKFCQRKEQQLLFKPEINILSLYELFFINAFQCSLVQLSLNKEFGSTREMRIYNQLLQLGISENDLILKQIMNLIDENKKSKLDFSGFYQLSKKYTWKENGPSKILVPRNN